MSATFTEAGLRFSRAFDLLQCVISGFSVSDLVGTDGKAGARMNGVDLRKFLVVKLVKIFGYRNI